MDVIDRYLAVWNTADADDRLSAVQELFTDDATYTDPLADVAGRPGIAAVVGGAREMFPGQVFRPYGAADAHHDLVRFGWALTPVEGDEPTVIGFDVAVLTPDGRIRAVHGFLDKAPG